MRLIFLVKPSINEEILFFFFFFCMLCWRSVSRQLFPRFWSKTSCLFFMFFFFFFYFVCKPISLSMEVPEGYFLRRLILKTEKKRGEKKKNVNTKFIYVTTVRLISFNSSNVYKNRCLVFFFFFFFFSIPPKNTQKKKKKKKKNRSC